MKACSLNNFLEEMTNWLDREYIHKAETNGKDHFILHFNDGTKHAYTIDDCNEKQIEDVLADLKKKNIGVERS